MKIIEKEFNVITGEETITEREETAQEKTEREALETENAHEELKKIQEQSENNTVTKKTALLARLGITEDEAKLLLG